MVYSFCIVQAIFFIADEMEKSFNVETSPQKTALPSALLLMRLPSLLIKPIASWRSLTRFVKTITLALDSCIFGDPWQPVTHDL